MRDYSDGTDESFILNYHIKEINDSAYLIVNYPNKKTEMIDYDREVEKKILNVMYAQASSAVEDKVKYRGESLKNALSSMKITRKFLLASGFLFVASSYMDEFSYEVASNVVETLGYFAGSYTLVRIINTALELNKSRVINDEDLVKFSFYIKEQQMLASIPNPNFDSKLEKNSYYDEYITINNINNIAVSTLKEIINFCTYKK